MTTDLSDEPRTTAPDVGVVPADAERSSPSAGGPTLRSTARRARGPVLLVVALALAAGLVGLLAASGSGGALDPGSYRPEGSHAVAALLADRGTAVRRVSTVPDAEALDDGSTALLLPEPVLLTRPELRRLAGWRGPLVVVGADDDQLELLAIDARAVGEQPVERREPACSDADAQRAGDADLGGLLYEPADGAGGGSTGCYAARGAASLLVLPGRPTVLLGAGDLLTNRELAHHGNAALALGVLGRADRLAWLLPDPARAVPAGDRPSLTGLLPAGVRLGVVQLLVAVVVLALWRARRLGRVVEEPLPVVVRASEAVEGRARLYQAAGARAAAAEALRTGVRDRTARRAGLPGARDRAAVVAAVAARAGRDAVDVDGLLYGAAPADDAALVRLGAQLRGLEGDVRAADPMRGGAGP